MSVQENKEVMCRLWEGKEYKGLSKDKTEQAVKRVLAQLCVPEFTLHSSRGDLSLETYQQYVVARNLSFPDETCTIKAIAGERDIVFAEIIIRGTFQQDFMGITANGKQVEERLVAIARFTNGKVSEGWGYYWAGNIMQLLGTLASS